MRPNQRSTTALSKTKPMRLEHCEPIRQWWNDRKEIVLRDEEGNITDYHRRRAALDATIDRTLEQIHQLLGI